MKLSGLSNVFTNASIQFDNSFTNTGSVAIVTPMSIYAIIVSRKSISSFLYLWINIFERYFNITKIFDNISNVMAIVVYAICWDTLHFCRPSIYYLQFLVIIKLIFFIELKLNYLYIFLEIELFIWFTVPVSFFT